MKRGWIYILSVLLILALGISGGCSGGGASASKASPSPAAKLGGKPLNVQLAALSSSILAKLASDPGTSVAVFNFSVAKLESARGEFLAKQLTLTLSQSAGRKGTAEVLSRPNLLATLKKGGFSPYDLLETDKFIDLAKAADCDYAVLGDMTPKQFTYLVDFKVLNWKGEEVFSRQIEIFRDDIPAERVNVFGRAMDKLARRLIDGYKEFDTHRVAVYEFKEAGIRTQLGQQIARELPNYLAKAVKDSIASAQFEILTRSQLDQIIREQRITMGDLFKQDNQAFGKLLKATAIISGDIAHREGGVYLTGQMVDLKTGKLVSTAEVRYIEETVGPAKARDMVGDTALKTDRDSESGLPMEIVSGKDKAVMVLVPGGLFKGFSFPGGKLTPFEKDLPAFYIDKYEVTNEQYCAFLNATRKTRTSLGKMLIDLHKKGTMIFSRGNEYKIRPGFDKHPVVNVSQIGARGYAAWAGKRLPEVMEWEKAAGWDPVKRAFRRYPWGDTWDKKRCNHGDRKGEDASDGYKTTAEAGAFENGKSFYNAFNMAGNAWEWTNTVEKRVKVVNNLGTKVETIVEEGIIIGGSFRKGGDSLTTTSVLLLKPETVNFSIGFRCVKDPK
ncbi:SUMF1/EgtB/PvdO family nonheme iron enzyme [Planctomycetota bacterium]